MKPVIVGLAAGILSVVLPSGLTPAVAIAGALLAGWVLPAMPVMAAILFLAPALVVGAVRLLADDSSGNLAGIALGIVLAVAFTAILTHVGAGLALRRKVGSG